MRIAGKRTAKQWLSLRRMLKSNPSPRLWKFAFDKYHLARIETRYLEPIASIQKHDKETGAGFAIVALFCTLIEFLESCERGHNFCPPGTPLKPKRYSYGPGKAGRYFKRFLRNREPFRTLIPRYLAESFYADVRCGLLHEARTKGSWTVSARYSSGAIVGGKPGKRIIYRNQLVPALRVYLNDYRSRLVKDEKTQKAFIRKWNHLAKA
jgi:hypothetical protein